MFALQVVTATRSAPGANKNMIATQIQGEPVARPPEYPKLRNLGKLIVLFNSLERGTVLNVPSDGMCSYKVGDYRTDWIHQNFSDFSLSITLANQS